MSSVKIGIGTAQFGMEYGISNTLQKTPPQEIDSILAFAEENDIGYLDTAPSYGDSEQVLGRTLPARHHFKISTKTPQFRKGPIDASDADHLEETFYRSLNHLRQDSVYAVLVHRADDLLSPGGQRLIEALMKLKQKGLTRKVGVSVYTQETIDKVLALFTPDMIQLPLSPFDQRLLQSGTLERLKNLDVELQARSIFLQGLLLMEPDRIPPYFKRVQQEIQDYHLFLRDRKLTPLQASVRFAMNVKDIDSFVCGVCTRQQLQEITAAVRIQSVAEDFSRFACEDESVLNPSLWQL